MRRPRLTTLRVLGYVAELGCVRASGRTPGLGLSPCPGLSGTHGRRGCGAVRGPPWCSHTRRLPLDSCTSSPRGRRGGGPSIGTLQRCFISLPRPVHLARLPDGGSQTGIKRLVRVLPPGRDGGRWETGVGFVDSQMQQPRDGGDQRSWCPRPLVQDKGGLEEPFSL